MAKKKSSQPAESSPEIDENASRQDTAKREYTVVARRYRPQQFNDLIGQEHVAKSLVNALQTGRVAHAYLFTGARGVGKTSAARILAKALNCVEGPTATPCDKCESCKAIATGDDVDVQEIDGASNNLVADSRDLRQNVGFRPTRSRFKIYIIDEVHMLTVAAFNALLKTLEEPPSHVKFIFATTEAQKIPITILSRCQRFDFANVGPGKIFEMLKRIVTQEGHEADDEALRLIARRASGSMRDSHSLLDQLLASSIGKLTVEHVHAVLGSGGEERVNELAAAILNHDAKLALDLIQGWVDQGLQVGELIDQMVGYWRSLMLVNCGGPDIRELPIAASQKHAITTQAKQLSLDTILAGLEVWATTRSRMRDTFLAQVQVEMAVVRLARMEDLLPIGQLVNAIQQSGGAVLNSGRPANSATDSADSVKKNGQMIVDNGLNGKLASTELSTISFTENALPEIWQRLIQHLSDKSPILANHLKSSIHTAIFGPNTLVIRFPTGYNHASEACATEINTLRIQEGLQKITGQTVVIRFEVASSPVLEPSVQANARQAPKSMLERRKTLMNLPMFQKAVKELGAQITHDDEDFDPTAAPKLSNSTPEDTDEI